MRFTKNWVDYELLDATNGERLERWGDIILIRPDPQIIWQTPASHPLWKSSHARYERSGTGGGKWTIYKKVPDVWHINYGKLMFQLKPMGFKHTGLFPEQAVNWDMMQGIITSELKSRNSFKVLNLFAYTGGATLACAAAGAEVTHVDASKGMVAWAKENANISGQSSCPTRWLVDDCLKLVEREIRRGNKYDGILMDPPSYGRGPSGEVWKLEESIFNLVKQTAQLLSDNASFFILNSYTTGLPPAVMDYLLSATIMTQRGGVVHSDEIGLPVTQSKLVLPCGSTAVWQSGNEK